MTNIEILLEANSTIAEVNGADSPMAGHSTISVSGKKLLFYKGRFLEKCRLPRSHQLNELAALSPLLEHCFAHFLVDLFNHKRMLQSKRSAIFEEMTLDYNSNTTLCVMAAT